MSIDIVKRLNKNVDLIDNNTGYTYISMSPDIADIRVVNQAIKITQRNGNVEFIENSDVNAIYVEPNAPVLWSSNVYDLLLELSQNYFYCCSASSTPPEPIAMKYGSFYDTTTQTTPATVFKPMEYNTNSLADGVSVTTDFLGRPNIIKTDTTGTYNVQFSAQIVRVSGGTADKVSIYLRKNGSDLPFTNTYVTLKSNSDFYVASWNFFVKLVDTDELQIIWGYATDQIDLVADNIISPQVPSVILTVNQIA